MKNIFDQTQINGFKFKNRLIRSATWEGLADENGNVSEELIRIYEDLAEGGVGTIISGFTTVIQNDSYLDGMMKFYDDKFIEGCKALTHRVHKYNCNILMQIAIGGYDKKEGNRPPFEINTLNKEDIDHIIEAFRNAAVRAKAAGFDGVQIHLAHGFFLSRFLSPNYNKRNDEYGGSISNRARIICEIYKAIRDEIKDNFLVTIKINSEDFMPGGLTREDSLVVCQLLANLGLDAIEVSGNYTSRAGIRSREQEGYFKEFATELKKQVNTPVILVGGHRSIENMNEILNTTQIEYLSLSRPLIREPKLINRWKEGDTRPSTCISCNRCYDTEAHKCIFNIKPPINEVR